jgi:uncharacterized protein (DUF302 family)
MIAVPTLAIDLPLRVLIWEDEKGRIWLGFNDPAWIGQRHHADVQGEAALLAMRVGIEALLSKAATLEA